MAMSRATSSLLAALAATLCSAAPCAAAPADSTGTLYALTTPPSGLEVGCQGPCECPIIAIPTYGSFELVQTGADALYTYYAVHRYIASFNNGPGAVAITGSGQYRVGGDVALMQELTLDLDIQGQPTQHFDSGLVPVRSAFPRIEVSCAVHGFNCFDSVLVVDAKSVDAANTPPAAARVGLQAVWPNPFTSRTTIAFTLDRPGTFDLTIVDLAGRRVRALASDRPVESGPQSVIWEGRRDDGRAAPAGVYWAVLRWAGGVDRRRFVKLD
jgi:hypothetical protein